MKNKRTVSLLVLLSMMAVAGCAGTNTKTEAPVEYSTPTVDYVEQLNVKDAPHTDSFLNQLAMNYRSYAIYNARVSGYPLIGELFAQKAVGAFSGETPYPESLDNWNIGDNSTKGELVAAYNDLIEEFKQDTVQSQPQLVAEAQAKFDCWVSATASGQESTARECKQRFVNTMQMIKDCTKGKVVPATHVNSETVTETVESVAVSVGADESVKTEPEQYYPETRRLNAMSGVSRTREGVVIVNNMNVPSNLIQPVPVSVNVTTTQQPTSAQAQKSEQPPIVFNQNIYGGEETANDASGDSAESDNDYVSKDEFVRMMMEMREELAAINKRLDDIGNAPAPSGEKTVIKVQQIPLEPKQHVMEEVFEIRFDFNKATIKPEYEDIIRKLAATTQENKNVKVSVVGHTDTSGSSNYNYALGGRRAEAVQKMLIEYGIPSSQIIAVSAGEEDLKVPTPNNTPNAENRRVRVVKEVHYTEPAKTAPIVVEEYSETDECDDCEENE